MKHLFLLSIRLLLGCCLAVASLQTAQAAYPQAGQLTYRYIGSTNFPNRYVVQVQYIWDCGGIQPATSFPFACRAGGCAGTAVTGTLTEVGTPVLGQPYCPSLQSTVVCGSTGNVLPETYLTHNLEGVVDLPPAAEWVISFDLASRTSTANISFGNLHLEATLNSLITPIGGTAQTVINNSAVFNPTYSAKQFVYVNSLANLTFTATDEDDRTRNGRPDSLVYSMDRPLDGCGAYAPYLTNTRGSCTPAAVNGCLYFCSPPLSSSQFSLAMPLPVATDTTGVCPLKTVQPRFYFNPSAGSITFNPNYYDPTGANNNASNRYAIAGQVTEYRKMNGRYYKVGSVRRDFMVVLVQPAAGTPPPNPPIVQVPGQSSGTNADTTSLTIRTCNYTRVALRFTSPNNTAASPTNTLLTVTPEASLNATSLQNGDIGTFVMSGNGTATPTGTFYFQPQQRTAGTVITTTIRIEDSSCPVQLVRYRVIRIRIVAGQTARITSAQGSSAGVCIGGALVLQGFVNRPDSVRVLSTGAMGLQTYNYQWSIAGSGNGLPAITNTQSITVNPTVTTRYRLTITPASGFDAGTCIDTTSIRAQAPPATPTVTRSGNVLTSSSATGNQWYLNGVLIAGATGQTYVATTSGAYTVVVTATTGGITCASMPSARFLSTQHALPGSSLSVAPNPTPDGHLNVTLTGYRELVTLTVFDALGRPVRQAAISAPNPAGTIYQLDLAPLASGLYILQVRTKGGVDTRQVVRE